MNHILARALHILTRALQLVHLQTWEGKSKSFKGLHTLRLDSGFKMKGLRVGNQIYNLLAEAVLREEERTSKKRAHVSETCPSNI